MAACAFLVLTAGGCGPANMREIKTEKEFDEQVLKADKPVLVDFFKGGCASCMFLDPLMDELSKEYKDRVLFFKFEGMRFWLEIPCWAIVKRYRLGLYPTAILFVDGKEKKRWVVNYSGGSYRAVLDEVAPAPAQKAAEAEKPPGEAATKAPSAPAPRKSP